MILPLPIPERVNRKKPMRWDRSYDEPVPADYWGHGDETPARIEALRGAAARPA